MKVRTTIDPTKILSTYKIEEYESGVFYCYAPEKSGKYELLAIVHSVSGEYVVDAESAIIALIPSATPMVEEPHRLYNTYVRAYGKTAVHVGQRIMTDKYCGHSVLHDEISSMTWENIRKLEYQIVKPDLEPEPDLEPDLEIMR